MTSSATTHEMLQVLLFTNGITLFGLPSDQVLEILYPHPVTPLPFVPPAIDGLINVEGRIAVQVNLGTLTDLPSTSVRQEVLLIDTGRALCGLKVDTVLSRTPLSRSEIEPHCPDNLPPATRELVSGTARWMGNAVAILDPARLGRLVRPEGLSEEGTGILGRIQSDDDRATEETTHCLVVLAAGERYALPLSCLVEIVEGGACTPIPGAPACINGLFLLRDEVILVVDLATRLDRPRPSGEQPGWFVVLDHAQGRCSFAFDEVIGIEQFANHRFQPSAEKETLVKGLFIGEQAAGVQQEPTLLLDASALVNDDIRTVLTSHNRDMLAQHQRTTEACLRFLQVDICGTPYAIAVESVKRVTPCFPMEAAQDHSGRIRGAIDLDGQIIPVLALEYGLALPGTVAEKEYVVIGDGEQEWVIGVESAQRIVDVPRSQVNRLTQSDARYVGGVAQIDERLVSLLDFSVLSEHSGELP